MPAATRDGCAHVDGENASKASPREQAEGSRLPAVTGDDCTPVDGEADPKALPTEERIRQMERHKKRKEAGLDKLATKREKVVEQHFDDCGRGPQLHS